MAGVVEGALRAEAAAHGVHPSRVLFLHRLPKHLHVSRLTACDLFVDNFLYGAAAYTAASATVGQIVLALRQRVGREHALKMGREEPET